jgi:hypothetical protein
VLALSLPLPSPTLLTFVSANIETIDSSLPAFRVLPSAA